jgi:hypothetical protein
MKPLTREWIAGAEESAAALSTAERLRTRVRQSLSLEKESWYRHS